MGPGVEGRTGAEPCSISAPKRAEFTKKAWIINLRLKG